MREKRNAAEFWWENLKETDHLEDPGVDGRIMRMDIQEIGWRAGYKLD
jgi:hypothetical protein